MRLRLPTMNLLTATAFFAAGFVGRRSSAQPIYDDDIYDVHPALADYVNSKCFSSSVTDPSAPSPAQFLAMFRNNHVEHNGRVFAAKSDGLYEVLDCDKHELLYSDPNIGQIVATSKFDPIQIISVDK